MFWWKPDVLLPALHSTRASSPRRRVGRCSPSAHRWPLPTRRPTRWASSTPPRAARHPTRRSRSAAPRTRGWRSARIAAGQYGYHGVRISDGAKLIASASASPDGSYVAKQDGVTYTVTSSALVVSDASGVIRREPMVSFHGPKTTQTPAATPRTPAGQASSAGRDSGPDDRRHRRRRCRRRYPPKSAAASTSLLAPQPKSIGSRCSCRFPRPRVHDRSRCS